MAIKAIINNIEKEIEQIKDSDEQDVDYVYSRIGDTEVEGEPPISIRSIGGNLADYRICGNTIDGKSVGDRTENLFDEKQQMITGVINSDGTIDDSITYSEYSEYIPIRTGIAYTVSCSYNTTKNVRIAFYNSSKQYIDHMIGDGTTVTITFKRSDLFDVSFIRICFDKGWQNIMLNEGSTALPYEPYGYKVPVTISNGTDTLTTPIYLPEPLKMVGDEAEYVDYDAQKMHRVRKNLLPNTATSQTINGITFTVNSDGSVTCNGTNHGNNPIIFELNNPDVVLPEGVYITSGCPAGGNITGGYKIQYFNGSGWNYELGRGSTFTLSGNLKYRSTILISKNVTVTNLTFYPMLRLASIEDDTYEPYIKDTDIDVTLPALSTIKGTNTFSVNTLIPPSMYIKDNFDYKKVFTATRTIEGESPLNYRSIEDSDSTLSNYRIYGQTVDGESVGDRTGNLFDGELLQGYWAYANGMRDSTSATWITTSKLPCKPNTDYSFKSSYIGRYFGFVWFDSNGEYISSSYVSDTSSNMYVKFSSLSPVDAAYLIINIKSQSNTSTGDSFTITPSNVTDLMLNEGSTALPYEPYGYKVPVTISNSTDTLTTNLYLPEQIRKVGDEAEYIDYGEQKFVKKFYKMTLNFDDMNNDETFPGWSGGTAVVEYCNKIRSLAINTPDGYMPMQRSSISNFKAMFAVNRSILFLGTASSIGHTQSELKEIYAGQSITFILKIPDTDLDVTLPALPTVTGTNVLSVGTEVQPSEIYIKGKIKEIN